MTIMGWQFSAKPSALIGTAALLVILLMIGLALIRLTPGEAVIGAVVGTALYWSGETIHQLGHGLAARRVGYPMIGLRYWALVATSLYPPDEPALPGSIHIRRALGGPIISLISTLIWGGVVLMLGGAPGSLIWWLTVWALLANLLVFTLGAMLPLSWTDGGTILYWWNKRT